MMPVALVFTVTVSPEISGVNRSRPRGAGPPFFSPTRLYCEPWHGHSNHCEVGQFGTRQPRCTHFWYRKTKPASIPSRTGAVYAGTFLAFSNAVGGYSVTHMRASGK